MVEVIKLHVVQLFLAINKFGPCAIMAQTGHVINCRKYVTPLSLTRVLRWIVFHHLFFVATYVYDF